MKATNNFREQLDTVSSWFKAWSECEQSVAIYWLLKRITATQARFLTGILDQLISECSQIQHLEQNANSADFVSALSNENKDTQINKLLTYLPLLRAGNSEAKAEYLKIIPDALTYSIEHRVQIEASRELLSYCHIHPALSRQERAWLRVPEEQFLYKSYQSSQSNIHSINHGMSNLSVSSSLHTLPQAQEKGSSFVSDQKIANLSSSTDCLNGWQRFDALDREGALDVNVHGSNQRLSSPLNVHLTSCISSNGHASLSRTSSGSSGRQHIPLHATLSAPPQIGHTGSSTPQTVNTQHPPPPLPSSHQQRSSNQHQQLRRTVSVIPGATYPLSTTNPGSSNLVESNHVQNPFSTVSHWLQSNDCHMGQNAKVLSATPDHAPLSPQSSVTSSGSCSDSHLDEGSSQSMKNSFLDDGSGMRDVPIWLKSLRLHKYTYLFQTLAYEDMLILTDSWLEERGVTQGARNKMLLSIQKLSERQDSLRTLEKDISEHNKSLISAFEEMKRMLNTPIKPFRSPTLTVETDTSNPPPPAVTSPPQSPTTASGEAETSSTIAEGDLPEQFARLMRKSFTELLVGGRSDNECFNVYLQLIDKCCNHEAFTAKQKSLLCSWKQQILQVWHPPYVKYGPDGKPRKSWGNTFPVSNNVGMRAAMLRPSSVKIGAGAGNPTLQWNFGAKRAVVGGTTSNHSPLSRNQSLNPALLARSNLIEKQAVTRTHSAPLRSNADGLLVIPRTGSSELTPNETEVNARTESLCLSMMDYALSSVESPDRTSTF